MTDVVKIAVKCRDELTAEIARLDDFIAMAEKLIKFEQTGTHMTSSTGRDAADGSSATTSSSSTSTSTSGRSSGNANGTGATV